VIWVASFVLTILVVIYVGYPLFAPPAVDEEDALERAVSQRRKERKGAMATDKQVACPQCAANNIHTDKFCARCGAQLSATCARCGAPYEASDAFCSTCGAKLAGVKRS
jgi:predicted amidophosphoribosyltransferase